MGGSAQISPAIPDRKRALREAALDGRAGLDVAAGGSALRAVIAREVEIPAGAAVACVWPLPGEVDLRPLLPWLHARGPVLLPETTPRGHALLFRLWTPGCLMLPGRFGTSHPDSPKARPDIVFVPLLAFDRTGGRLGYGGGYYDRTLAALPSIWSVGYGLAAQQVEEVPCEPHDVKLDAIVTDRGVLIPDRTREAAPIS